MKSIGASKLSLFAVGKIENYVPTTSYIIGCQSRYDLYHDLVIEIGATFRFFFIIR